MVYVPSSSVSSPRLNGITVTDTPLMGIPVFASVTVPANVVVVPVLSQEIKKEAANNNKAKPGKRKLRIYQYVCDANIITLQHYE
jgi:hypothetical protein